MKRRTVVVLFVCFIQVVLLSTVMAEEVEEKKNSLQKGAWAMQFQVYGSLLDFQIYDYLGQTFSGKYHHADRRALRFGVELSGSTADVDKTESENEAAGIMDVATDQKLSSQSYSGICQYLWYLRENNGFHFMIGLGPQLSVSWSKSDLLRTGDYDLTDVGAMRIQEDVINKSSTYYLGLAGSLGFEYFVGKNLSAMMEFQSSGGYRYKISETTRATTSIGGISENDSHQSNKQTTREFKYSSTRVKIGLSVYF